LHQNYRGDDGATVSGALPGILKLLSFSNELTISIDEVDGERVWRGGGITFEEFGNWVRLPAGKHQLRLEVSGGFPPKPLFMTIEVNVLPKRAYQFTGKRNKTTYLLQFWDSTAPGPEAKPIFETTLDGTTS
jgi:hypothetical protein